MKTLPKIWVGLDPGAKGAIAAINENGEVEFHDFADGELFAYRAFLRRVGKGNLLVVGLEQVTAMPKQGVVSMFSFGSRFGELKGLLVGMQIGYTLVRPLNWQRACAVKPKSKKKGIYQAVKAIYPDAPLEGTRGGILEGRCDSLGIAHYMRKTFN